MTGVSLIILGMLSACSESGGGSGHTTVTTAEPSTMAVEQQSQTEQIPVKEFDLGDNKKIVFLSEWARNFAGTKSKDVALELF